MNIVHRAHNKQVLRLVYLYCCVCSKSVKCRAFACGIGFFQWIWIKIRSQIPAVESFKTRKEIVKFRAKDIPHLTIFICKNVCGVTRCKWEKFSSVKYIRAYRQAHTHIYEMVKVLLRTCDKICSWVYDIYDVYVDVCEIVCLFRWLHQCLSVC